MKEFADILSHHKLFSFKHLFKGAVSYGMYDVINAILRFSLLAVYTRYLMPADFGIFAIYQVSILIGTSILTFGIPSYILIVFRSNKPSLIKEAKDKTFSILFLTSSVFICLVVSSMLLFNAKIKFIETLIYLLIWGFSNVIQFVPSVSLRFKENICYLGAAKITGTIISILFIGYNVVKGTLDLQNIIIAEVLGSIWATVICFIFDVYVPRFCKKNNIKTYIVNGIPFCLLALGVILIDLSDRYVVYNFLGKDATGYYAVAAKIVIIVNFVIEAFNSMWTPYYYRLAGNNNIDKNNFKSIFIILLILSFVLITLFMILLPYVYHIELFGKTFINETYKDAIIIIPPLVLAYFFKMVFNLNSVVLEFNNMIWKLSFFIYIGVFINIVGNIIAVKYFNCINVYNSLYVVSLVTAFTYMVCMFLALKDTIKFYKLNYSLIFNLFFVSCVILLFTFLPVAIKNYLFVAIVIVSALIILRLYNNYKLYNTKQTNC